MKITARTHLKYLRRLIKPDTYVRAPEYGPQFHERLN